MKFFLKAIKVIGYFFLAILLFIAGYFGFYYWKKNQKNDELIIIEATFMQYACGDWNDDMQVQKVNQIKYKFLLGKDIDPHVDASQYNLKDYFYDNRTEKHGMKYRLKGYLSKYPDFGCDDTAPKFWVEEIEKLDKKNRKIKNNFR